MAPFKNINPLDGDFATYNSTVQQPQQQQAEFEQHLNELHQADALNPDRELFDISEEDDRLIRAAADAALDRRGEPRAVTIGNYERSLRKLADALKPSGQTITMLDHKSLLDHAKRLFPRDKVIVPALSMLSRHREPDAPARPITPQYRASKEDEDLIRRAAEGNFCRTIGHQTGEDYANRLRKLSAALQPSSIAVLDHGSLVRHAKRLFPGNERLVYALNRLDDYRRRGASRRKRGGSRLALEPAANAPVQSVRQEQLLDTEASRSAGVAPPTVRRAVLNPYPNDLALIEAYKAAPAEGISEDTAINYANRLTGFSVHLRKKSKPGIAARLHDGSLDTDVKDYKDSDGRYVGAALAHFRKSLPHGALELGQHTDPEDAVARRVGKSPAQHSASEGSASGPEILLPAEGHDQDVISGMMDEADPSSLFEPTPRDHQAPDPDEAIHPLNWPHNDQPAPDDLTGSNLLPSDEVLSGKDYTGQWRPATRQKTLSNPHGDATGRQLSEIGNSGGRVLMQGPIYQLSASPWEAQLILRGSGHQHVSAPHDEDGVVASPVVLPAEDYDQDLLWGAIEEAPPPSLEPTPRDHHAPDPDEAIHLLNWPHNDQPAPDDLTGSNLLPRDEVLSGEDYTGQWSPAKRQKTLSNPQGDATGRQLSEIGNSGGRVMMQGPIYQLSASPWGAQLIPQGSGHQHVSASHDEGGVVASPVVLPAEDYDQDLLRGTIEEAGAPSSLGPTARHPQAPDFGEAVRHLNWRHGHQRAPDELIAALDRSGLPPSQENQLTSLLINGEHYTAGLMPAGMTTQSTPLNSRNVAIGLRYRPEGVPQLSSRPENHASPEHLGRTMEQAGPVSAMAEATSPAVGESFDVSFATPEDFSHRTQPVPDRMLSRLRQFGFLPNAAQRVMSYNIRGERYWAVLGPGGLNDFQLIHHPPADSEAAPAAPARAPVDIYGGLESLVGWPSTAQQLGDGTNYLSLFPRTPSDAQIGALGPTALRDHSGLELGAIDWLGDEHIAADYALLEQELQRDNPDLAMRTRFADPLIAHYHLRLGADGIALRAFQRLVHNQNGNDTADFLFLPLNDASATDPNRRGTHWSLLLIDRRERAWPVAYHYDSRGTTNSAIAAELAGRLGSRLQPARLAQQQNGYDCGVFVVDGTRALVRRLAQGERPQHEPLHLDNLVADRQALQYRLRTIPTWADGGG